MNLPEQYTSHHDLDPARTYIHYLGDVLDFLTSDLPATLLQSHPNSVALETFEPPLSWSSWWNWAGDAADYDPAHAVLQRACMSFLVPVCSSLTVFV
jgi:hypothetical protein